MGEAVDLMASLKTFPGDCSEYCRHVDGWTTADAAAVEQAMVVSSALAEASSSPGSSSSTTVLTKPGVLDQVVSEAALGHKICSWK